jgi:hypothetical protein
MERRATGPEVGDEESSNTPRDITKDRAVPVTERDVGRRNPRLDVAPPGASRIAPRRIDMAAVLGGIAVAVILALIMLFTFMPASR